MSDQAQRIRGLLSEESASFQNAMETIELADGEVLFQRGDPGDAFYIVESGQVRVFTYDEEGKELTLNALDAGEAFGELALVDDRPRSASIAAIGPATLRRLRRKDFMARVHTSPALSEIVLALLSQRTRHMTDYIERLGHWARLVAEGHYKQAMENIEAQKDDDRALAAVADAVRTMVQAVQEREEQLRQAVAQLQIEIDDRKRQRQVEEITETDYFQKLKQQASTLRKKTDT